MTKSIPINRTRLDITSGPTDVLRMLRGRDRLVGLIGSWHAGEAIIGWDPSLVATQDPFDAIDRHQPLSTHGCGFGGGWIGAWGFPARMAADSAAAG